MIPNSVQQLVARSISSVGELETLLLTHRTKGRCWRADDAARELRISPELAMLRLDQLVDKGFLNRSADEYTYVAEGRRDAAVGDLQRAYATYRTRIVSMIFS